ncbi:MerR family transcriptional regulator [Streptoalloteichus tenebrarius]|uniref:MerR family transcriptional regulator n=1 Tax=Streptoalloteichus tenebrarius (strain ATCC 17920 / DSM 40477 / JCM 4838 / CBS 697.72 / NBRC 16177 / NCIMB 11028 / NRRL B-12390 / A12253. 1 / ISP 5477) TaxID=1933 RepID=UPI003555D24D
MTTQPETHDGATAGDTHHDVVGMADFPEPTEVEPPGTGMGGTGPETGRDSEPRLTVAAVARRLGVAPATLRTWDRRYGLGPSDHTSGRHRRYGPQDVARLELMQHALLRGASPAEAARYALTSPLPALQAATAVGRPPVEAVGPSPGAEPLLLAGGEGEPDAGAGVGGRVLRLPGASRRARGLGRAALAMDAAAALHLVADAIAEDGVVGAWDGVIRPVLAAVGERWEHSGAGVAVEHMLNECVMTALARATASAPPPCNPRPVLLACVPEDQHVLPLRALAAALALRGVGSLMLGPALPVDALVAAVRRTAPAAVVLWAQLPHQADPRLLAAVPRTRQRVRVFAGGPGWEPLLAPAQVEVLEALGPAADRVEQAVLGPRGVATDGLART